MPIAVGAPAPDAALRDDAGAEIRLSALWSAAPLLIVFYPGDDTPVCTAQLCEYRDRWGDLRARGAGVVGVNPAGPERHRRFRERHGFPFPLLADPDGACCRAYGAAAWYGTRRLVVLVDRGGVVRWIRRSLPFLRPRADELLGALRAMDATRPRAPAP